MLDFSDVKLVLREIKELEEGKLLGVFEIYPLPRGYGHTVGNTLRRTLLSSIPGYAITRVRVGDKPHEFSTVPGVLENVLDIVLRLKRVRFRVKGDAPVYTIRLKTDGKKVGELKAGDMQVPSEVEVVNKDLVIATVTDKGVKLEIEADLQKGIGYVERDESVRDELGAIPVDAVFSPVKVVDYKVLPVSKQGEVRYEKVELVVETDGGVTPEEAVREAVRVVRGLIDHLAYLLDKEGGEDRSNESQSTIEEAEGANSIDDLGLPANIVAALKSEGITSIEALALITEEDLLNIKGIGKAAVKKIKEVLKSRNIG